MNNEYRISKLRDYLFTVINTLTENRNYQINANMLSDKIDDYSIDKIPAESEVQRFITGESLHRDVYSFRSRKAYSKDTINNLKNIGFFELFEDAIDNNNKNRVLPDITGIQSISCLNCGTMVSATDGNKAEFDIQIQIEYIKERGELWKR